MTQENLTKSIPQTGIEFSSKGKFLYTSFINNELYNVFSNGDGTTYAELNEELTKELIKIPTVYIKRIGNRVLIGGQVASEHTIADGWEPYYGTIIDQKLGEYDYFVLENDALVVKTDEVLKNKNLVKEMKDYLNKTDFKMTVDYFDTLTEDKKKELIEKRAQARQLIRELDVEISNSIPLENTTINNKIV